MAYDKVPLPLSLLTVMVLLISSQALAHEVLSDSTPTSEKIVVKPKERQTAQQDGPSAPPNQILGMKQIYGPNLYDQGSGYGTDYDVGGGRGYGQGYGGGGYGQGYGGGGGRRYLPYSIPCYVPGYTAGRRGGATTTAGAAPSTGTATGATATPGYYDGYGPCIVYGGEGYGYRYRYSYRPYYGASYDRPRQ